MLFPDKIVGLHHFLTDRTPRNIPEVAPRPRKINPWTKDGSALVAKVKADEGIRFPVERAIDLLGNLRQIINPGDKVFIKPNFNSPDPPPASTDLPFLQAVVELLLDAGARITIGESSGGVWRPTRNVFRKLGVDDLARTLGVRLIAFEDEKDGWVRISIAGDYLRSVTMPRAAYEADRMIYLPCIKTHLLARYSGALKLAFGFVHPGERRRFHLRDTGQKLAEISLCWQPDLVIMDGRKVFITDGPDHGKVAEPGIILASGDLVAIDIEGIKLLQTNGAFANSDFRAETSLQITTALRHNLGSGTGKYVVVESPAASLQPVK